jgi:hypothetical protein
MQLAHAINSHAKYSAASTSNLIARVLSKQLLMAFNRQLCVVTRLHAIVEYSSSFRKQRCMQYTGSTGSIVVTTT